MVALFLSQDIRNFFLWIYKIHHEFNIVGDTCRPQDRFAFFGKVVEKIVKIFSLVNAEKCIIFFKLCVEIVFSERCKQIPFLIRSKGIHENLIHFHHNGELPLVLGMLGRQQFGLDCIFFL